MAGVKRIICSYSQQIQFLLLTLAHVTIQETGRVTDKAISSDSESELDDRAPAGAYSNVNRVKIAHKHTTPEILVVSIISLVILVD
jgi:hypothetical protein